MTPFHYQQGELHVEALSLAALAERFGTPLYVYSADAIEQAYRAFTAAFAAHPHQLCYAVKANANLAVLQWLAHLGAGFDIVSGGELERVLRAGGDPARVVFSGVGKRTAELQQALAAGVGCFNIESAAELARLEAIAREQQQPAPISIRVNPDVDAATHPYISTGLKENKFGVAVPEAADLYRHAAASRWLEVVGIDCHIGSQLTQTTPFLDAIERILALVDELNAEGIHFQHLDLGGGLGVQYRDETPPAIERYAADILQAVAGRNEMLLFEPGRWLVANAGVMLTRLEYLKVNEGRSFLVVDAAMNDLLRPALYSAWHDIDPVRERPELEPVTADVVGPVCESADFLGKQRTLRAAPGDLLAVRSAGAYGFGMASNYNSRNRPAEVLVHGDQAHLARQRETVDDQLRLEQVMSNPATF